jgi:hypothetical protein
MEINSISSVMNKLYSKNSLETVLICFIEQFLLLCDNILFPEQAWRLGPVLPPKHITVFIKLISLVTLGDRRVHGISSVFLNTNQFRTAYKHS